MTLLGSFGDAFATAFDTDSRPSSNRLWQAALLYCIRNIKLNDAPLGVAGGFDLGQLYVGRVDEDLNRLMKGYRGTTIPEAQTWPTLQDVKDRLQITSTQADTFIQQMLDSAIEQVTADTTMAFGIA